MANMDLTGRKALVTGGARGIGASVATALAKAGASDMIGDVLHELGRETAASIGGQFTPLDVTSDAAWERAVGVTVAELGGLDILINNAGIEVTALVADIDGPSALKMLEVNVLGTALGMKHAFRAMRPGGAAAKGGAVVNIASVAATIAFPAIAVYSGSKAAIDRMTRVAAVEAGKLGYGVRVNCIYPGLAGTEMGLKLADDIVKLGLAGDITQAIGGVVEQTPLGRLVDIGEIADAAVFLCSDAARFITGVGLPVDGGMGT